MHNMGTIKDQLIKIKPSQKLKDFIVDILKDDQEIPKGIQNIKLKDKVEMDLQEEPSLLDLSDIRWLKEYLLSNDDGKGFLHELLEGCDVKLPEPEVTPRNPVLETRIKRLQLEQDARDYHAMTKNVDCVRVRHPEDTISYQMKQINKQLIAVGQFLLSVAAGFAFGFIGVELIVGSLDFGFRLLLGVMCALIIALAEIYFLAKKLSEDVFPPIPTPGISTNDKPHQE